jgi:hypothetical protein
MRHVKSCPVCNSEYENKFGFCRKDGAALITKEATALDESGRIAFGEDREGAKELTVTQGLSAAPVNVCPECGSEYPRRYRFCRLDGAALVGKRISEPPQAETKKNIPSAGVDPIASQEDHQESQENSPRVGMPFERVSYSSAKFELLAQEEIKNTFPLSFVRVGVQIKSFRRTAEADLFVLLPRGLFLIECKNYTGKIRGSMNYDQNNDEFWTCETPSGETIQIKSSGKNPADQALSRFWALHEMARDAWGEENRPYIYPVLLFPDGADLSGVTGLTVYPERPSSRDRVVATTLSRLLGYLANADSPIERSGALKLVVDFLGIPANSLSGTWLENAGEPEPQPKPIAVGDVRANNGAGDSVFEPSHPDTGKRLDHPPVAETDSSSAGEPRPGKNPWKLISAGLAAALVLFVGWYLYRNTESLKRQEDPKKQASTNRTQGPVSQPTIPRAPPSDSDVKSPTSPAGTKEREPFPTIPLRGSPETPIVRKSAEPGTYETIRTTSVRRGPSESAELLDELEPRIRLNVRGSQGDWLVVWSKTRQMTGYVHRNDAKLVSNLDIRDASNEASAADWKRIEEEVAQSLARAGLAGVTVSVRNGVVYLEGRVDTDQERFRAQSAAQAVPGVRSIRNRVMVVPQNRESRSY